MKKLENQKEIIFETAKEILINENVEKFSIRMISTRCNIGMGTIYKYYGNKDDIILDIIRDLWMSYLREVRMSSKVYSTLFEYVEYLFFELNRYSEKFNYMILSKELSSSFRKNGHDQHQKAQELFVDVLREKIDEFYLITHEKRDLYATFIANNLISMIMNRSMDYKIFISVLTDLLMQQEERK